MIFLRDYFGPWFDHEDATDERKANAEELLDRVNALLLEADAHEVELIENPATGTYVSGQTYGGFRPQSCPIGAPNSSHKQGKGVDIYDPNNALDNWISDGILAKHDLFREVASATSGWVHLTSRAPRSGKRSFFP